MSYISSILFAKIISKKLIVALLCGGALIVFGVCAYVLFCGDPKGMKFKTESVDFDTCPVSERTLVASVDGLEVGTGYLNSVEDGVVIGRVVDSVGVIASGIALGGQRIFVRTNRHYVDGAKLAFGLYVCNGTVKIEQKDGGDVWISDTNGSEPFMMIWPGQLELVNNGLKNRDSVTSVTQSTEYFKMKPYAF